MTVAVKDVQHEAHQIIYLWTGVECADNVVHLVTRSGRSSSSDRRVTRFVCAAGGTRGPDAPLPVPPRLLVFNGRRECVWMKQKPRMVFGEPACQSDQQTGIVGTMLDFSTDHCTVCPV